jgi:hypothetical protein
MFKALYSSGSSAIFTADDYLKLINQLHFDEKSSPFAIMVFDILFRTNYFVKKILKIFLYHHN